MDFLVLQDLFTVRNGGFATYNIKAANMKKKKNKNKTVRCSSSSSLSLPNHHVTALSSHKRSSHFSSNQVTDSKTRLWKLVSKGELDEAFTYLNGVIVSGESIPDLAICRGLIEALCSTGRTRKAARVIELLERSNSVTLDTRTYTKFVEGLCKAGEIDSALNILRRLDSREEDDRFCKPDVYMYNNLINALFRKGRFEQGMKLLDEMRSKGCKADNVTCSTVVNGLCKQGRIDEAVKIVTSRDSTYGWTPCVESYNAVLNCLCYTGRFSDSAKLLADMAGRDGESGCSPSAVTFTILIRTLCSKGLLYRAIALLESMPEYDCVPNLYHYNRVVHGLCKLGDMGMAIECIEVMMSRGCYPTIVVFNTLLAALWEHGKVDAGMDLFRELIGSGCCPANVASYDIVVEGLASSGRVDEALRLLDEARGVEGFKPDSIAYARLVIALVGERRVGEAMEIFDELKRSRVVVPAKCFNWIIKGLCEAGDVDRAIEVVVYMVSKGGRGGARSRPSHSTFADVIEGLAKGGFGRESVELLNELIERGAMNRGMSVAVAERLEKICRLE